MKTLNDVVLNSPVLVVGVAPLWELEYTGIANVVFELTRRFLLDQNSGFEIKFSVFNHIIDTEIIETCIQNRNGSQLRLAFEKNEGIRPVQTTKDGLLDGRLSYGLFLHIKPAQRVFTKDSHLYYDFSFLLTQECHTQDTVDYHLNDLVQQIATTDLFFCISESTASDLRWLFGIAKEKTVVSLLGNNVDTVLATAARKKIGSTPVEPYFLLLGTIEPRKNIALVFEWLSKNPGILQKYRFVFAGRQGWGQSFEDYAEKSGLAAAVQSGRIVHLGYINESVKATLIVGAQAILYPSIFEGFGLPVLEAMELGVPVIASCSTSIPEVLGETGYYFDPYSVESLDKAFSAFLFDQCTGRLEALIGKAKTRASEFSYDRTYFTICNSLRLNFLKNEALLLDNPVSVSAHQTDIAVCAEHLDALNDESTLKRLPTESAAHSQLLRTSTARKHTKGKNKR